jgi:HEAT repeat protein
LAASCCFAAWLSHTLAGEPQPTQLSPAEQQEYELVRKGLREHEDLLTAGSWTLVHCADEKEVKHVEKTLNLLQAFADAKQIPKLVEAGGVKQFKDNVTNLLKNKDPVVRGFGAVLLAVIGDTVHKSDIARLLEDKRGSPPKEEDRLLYYFDRSRAAMALGLMGAAEYAPRLAALLQSSDYADRTGAALGLGYMGAKEHINALAKLLSDDADQVQTAAMQSLAELAAADYAKDIAKLLTSLGDPSVNETACYALVRLNAKQQAKELAALLDDEFRKGNAAKALALLGARDYTKDIAGLIEDSEPLVRCDALIALGILGAKECVTNIATHLRDKEPFVRAYAAVALLLMGDQKYSEEVEEVVLTEMKLPEIVSDGVDTTAYFRVRLKLHPVVAQSQQRLVTRTVQEWQRTNRSQKRLQQDGPANGSQPIRSETNRTSSAAGSRR